MDIAGIWYNELGSMMDLTVVGNTLTGNYMTAVGNARGKYPLYGAFVPAVGETQAVGWTVAWVNESGSSRSVTGWSAQYQDFSGNETIIATWLLTQETTQDQDWASTLVGRDTFSRTAPTAAQVAEYAHRYPWSHPVS